MALSPESFIEAEKVLTALELGAKFNWDGAIEAFKSQSTQDKIEEGLIAADEVAAIVGVFLPPAAVVANDLGVVIAVEPLVYQALAWIAKQPLPAKILGQFTTWGEVASNSLISTVTGWFRSVTTVKV